MTRFLIHEELRDTPVTHAIVIGVGDYPHLIDGNGTLSESHDGMGQLTSPQESALQFTKWLINEYKNPSRPLATVSLLISAENTVSFTNARTNQIHQIERANMPNVETAIYNWKALGDANKENMMLFFFSGHGIAQGPDTSLLLEDYGANANNVFKGAIDFRKFHLGMARCTARDQLYFVDACRSNSNSLLESFGNAGAPIISPQVSELRTAHAPIFYSTVAGASAFGRTNKPSYFTESLLRGLRGGGADDITDRWTVSTTRLKEALDRYMQLLFASRKVRRAQTPEASGLITFDLLELENLPITPVIVSCSSHALESAVLSCSSQTGFARSRPTPETTPWEVEVPGGENYTFKADFPTYNFSPGSKNKSIRPPLRKVLIEVRQ